MLTAMNELKAPAQGGSMSRLISLRHDFPAAWAQLFAAGEDVAQSCTLQMSKQDFPAFVDYAWLSANDGTKEPVPIDLNVTSLLAYLAPKGVLAANSSNITLNEQSAGDSDVGIPMFDITESLSASVIDNHNVVELELAVSGEELLANEWNDVYLLLDYEVTT